MRFRMQVNLWMDVNTLADAQTAAHNVELAALEAIAANSSTDPLTGAELTSQLEPDDERARQAFEMEDLGPGISSAVWPAGR